MWSIETNKNLLLAATSTSTERLSLVELKDDTSLCKYNACQRTHKKKKSALVSFRSKTLFVRLENFIHGHDGIS